MGLRDMILNDYLIEDDPEIGLLTIVSRLGDTFAIIQRVGRDELTARELAPSRGAYTASDVAFFIPVALVPTITPKPADRLTVASVERTILEVAQDPSRVYWRVITRDVKVHFDLQDTGYLLRPANKADGHAGRKPELAAVVSDIPCKVQERERTPETVHGRRAVRISYSAYVGYRLYPQAQDVFRTTIYTDLGPINTDFTIVGSVDPDRIDQIQELQLERIE